MHFLSLLPLAAIFASTSARPLWSPPLSQGLSRRDTPVWLTLPPTPTLPGSPAGTTTAINGVNIWHAEFGDKSKSPVILIHGGFGNSDYWGGIVSALMNNYYVIVFDLRGCGRSTMNSTPFTYDLYASDAAAVLASLNINKAAWVGWSDGGDATLAAMLSSSVSSYVGRAFIYGANHNVAANNATFTSTNTYQTFVKRAIQEYQTHQPNGNVTLLEAATTTLENSLPNWTASDLGKISLGGLVTISGGQYEEAVNLNEAATLQGMIQGSKLVTMTSVSHFAPLQDPTQFANDVEAFLSA